MSNKSIGIVFAGIGIYILLQIIIVGALYFVIVVEPLHFHAESEAPLIQLEDKPKPTKPLKVNEHVYLKVDLDKIFGRDGYIHSITEDHEYILIRNYRRGQPIPSNSNGIWVKPENLKRTIP
jgi:hypothetical protein